MIKAVIVLREQQSHYTELYRGHIYQMH